MPEILDAQITESQVLASQDHLGADVCLICRQGRLKKFCTMRIRRLALRDYLAAAGVQSDTIPLVKCSDCHCVYQWPTFPRPVYIGWYADRHYEFLRGNSYGDPDLESRSHASIVLETLKTLVEKSSPRLLDVGCGTGTFLEVCAEAGWTVFGCDPSAHRIFRHKRPLWYSLTAGPFEDAVLGPSPFDVISFLDVFEHFQDPQESLEKARRLLNEDGVIVIEVPNVLSLYSRLRKKYWWYDFEHVFYYSTSGLLEILNRSGFSPVLLQSDNFNLLSCEGLARLGMFGSDLVWGRIEEGSTSLPGAMVRGVFRRSKTGVGCKALRGICNASNDLLNRIANRHFLGDQLRVFAKKLAASPRGESRGTSNRQVSTGTKE